MRLPTGLLVSCSLLPAVFAQQPDKPPPRSLAAGLVRQRVEIDKLEPPTAAAGLEIGAGNGPMVLLVRRRDGSLELHELQRGGGEHGAAAVPSTVKEEEPEVDGAPVATTPLVKLSFADGKLTIADPHDARLQQGKDVDRVALQPALTAACAAAKATPFAGLIELQCAPEVSMQHVLTVWEVARAAGFEHVQFHGNGSRPLPAAQRDLIDGIQAKYDWPVRHIGPRQQQPACSGELLVLLDGPALWRDLEPLIYAFAKAGIWEFGFVARKDATTFVKLPTHLPMDKGK